jgi:two-component system, sensor histidine kinase and response regulator
MPSSLSGPQYHRQIAHKHEHPNYRQPRVMTEQQPLSVHSARPEDTAALYRVASAIIEHTELDELLQIVADSVAEALPAERIAIITMDIPNRRVLRFVKGGEGVDSVRTVPFEELEQGLSGWVLREHAPALSLAAAPDPRESAEVQKRRADTNCGDIIVVPLRYQGKTLGTMTAINRPQGRPFSQQQVDLMMAMATQSAVAITTANDQALLRREIEERKALQASLAQARDEALESSRLKSQFMANMSHEIRTPMNAILGMLNLLQSTDLTDRQRDYASKTEGAAKSLLGLLNDVLDFSKAEAGKLALESEPFQIDVLMLELAVILSANVGGKDLELLFDIDPALPSVVLGDAMRLKQVLINLGGNAVKFSQAGHVLLGVHVVDTTQTSVRVAFSLQDTGIGIAPENLDKIFAGFSQAEASTTRVYGGTGLGLAISQHFVRLMGGEIQVSSVLGVGSTFSFTLDLSLDTTRPAKQVLLPAPTLARQNVLVVDDNPVAGTLARRMLESFGWPVDVAQSGETAMQMLASKPGQTAGEFPYSVVLVDWQMPIMDGWEVTRKIRQFAQTRALTQPTIIMVTAHEREHLARRTAQEQGMLNGFLLKPVTASLLFNAVVDATTQKDNVRQPKPTPSFQSQLAGMRILVVEDNPINQLVAKGLLSARGAIVTLAANGRLGVDAVAAANPQFHVVLMDIQMPELDGYGATKAIREELGFQQLPIVAMTANVMASDRIACLEAGMTEHVGKPFDIGKLASLLLKLTGYQPANA